MPSPADGLSGLSRLSGLSPRGMRLGLEPIREALSRLCDPQRRVPRILIGGTNGKGSVAATVSAILRAAEIPSGLHTSPHLVEATERVRLDERDVAAGELSGALDAVFEASDRAPSVPLTYFEALTAAAEVLFDRAGCRRAVVEVGLGGRLDATNASEPDVSVVTSIGLDHVEELGDTLEKIAREKAGIFRAGRPALTSVADGPAAVALAEHAARVGAPLERLRDAAEISGRAEGETWQEFTLATRRGRYRLRTPLLGAHQVENVSLAVLSAEHLAAFHPSLDAAAIARGVERTRWPGRLEPFDAGGARVWLDGCHNAPGAEALARFLGARGLSPALLFGAMADKDIAAIAAALFPRVSRIVLAAPATDRSAPPEEIARRTAPLSRRVEIAESIEDGLARLCESEPVVLVAGSLFLVGQARKALLAQGALRSAA